MGRKIVYNTLKNEAIVYKVSTCAAATGTHIVREGIGVDEEDKGTDR